MSVLDYLKHYSYEDYTAWKGNWELYEGFPIAMSPALMINKVSSLMKVMILKKLYARQV